MQARKGKYYKKQYKWFSKEAGKKSLPDNDMVLMQMKLQIVSSLCRLSKDESAPCFSRFQQTPTKKSSSYPPEPNRHGSGGGKESRISTSKYTKPTNDLTESDRWDSHIFCLAEEEDTVKMLQFFNGKYNNRLENAPWSQPSELWMLREAYTAQTSIDFFFHACHTSHVSTKKKKGLKVTPYKHCLSTLKYC